MSTWFFHSPIISMKITSLYLRIVLWQLPSEEIVMYFKIWLTFQYGCSHAKESYCAIKTVADISDLSHLCHCSGHIRGRFFAGLILCVTSDSPLLKTLHDKFLAFMNSKEIPCLSFGETKPTSLGMRLELLIVPLDSSGKYLPSYHSLLQLMWSVLISKMAVELAQLVQSGPNLR